MSMTSSKASWDVKRRGLVPAPHIKSPLWPWQQLAEVRGQQRAAFSLSCGAVGPRDPALPRGRRLDQGPASVLNVALLARTTRHSWPRVHLPVLALVPLSWLIRDRGEGLPELRETPRVRSRRNLDFHRDISYSSCTAASPWQVGPPRIQGRERPPFSPTLHPRAYLSAHPQRPHRNTSCIYGYSETPHLHPNASENSQTEEKRANPQQICCAFMAGILEVRGQNGAHKCLLGSRMLFRNLKYVSMRFKMFT